LSTVLSHLGDTERRAYILADNKLALNAGWDNELLAIELQGLLEDDFDVDLTGFSIAEIDFIIEDAESANPDTRDPKDYEVPDMAGPVVTRMGDL
jgi:ParB-like chromosome segregation protein Spo0J